MMTNKYRETEILSAAPERLLIITFDGLIAAMTRARVAAAASRSDVLFPALEKSRDILGELLASLDFNRGGAIARQLSSIYVFQLSQLQTMGMTPDVAHAIAHAAVAERDRKLMVGADQSTIQDGIRYVPSGAVPVYHPEKSIVGMDHFFRDR